MQINLKLEMIRSNLLESEGTPSNVFSVVGLPGFLSMHPVFL